MAAAPPTLPPAAIEAGTTVVWTRTPTGDHAERTPANGWALSILVQGEVSATFASAAVGSGNTWTVTLTATNTGTLRAGPVRIVERLTKAAEVYTHSVTPCMVTALVDTAGDGRTQAEKDLAAVEAVLSGRYTADLESYSIGGRSVTKIALRDLQALRTSLQHTVLRARRGGVLPAVAVSFVYGR